jgi:hypothetical protein
MPDQRWCGEGWRRGRPGAAGPDRGRVQLAPSSGPLSTTGTTGFLATTGWRSVGLRGLEVELPECRQHRNPCAPDSERHPVMTLKGVALTALVTVTAPLLGSGPFGLAALLSVLCAVARDVVRCRNHRTQQARDRIANRILERLGQDDPQRAMELYARLPPLYDPFVRAGTPPQEPTSPGDATVGGADQTE